VVPPGGSNLERSSRDRLASDLAQVDRKIDIIVRRLPPSVLRQLAECGRYRLNQ
jgi:hypothetical protein